MDVGHYSGFELSMKDPGIAWFQFNTPERLNGMKTAIKPDMIEAITQAQMDNVVRVLVFTGSGRAFWAGDDLKAYRDAELGGTPLVPAIPPGHDNALGTYNGLRTISQQLNTSVRSLDKLTIAAVNGVAIQTGFSLALSCDFRIASQSSCILASASGSTSNQIRWGSFALCRKSSAVPCARIRPSRKTQISSILRSIRARS